MYVQKSRKNHVNFEMRKIQQHVTIIQKRINRDGKKMGRGWMKKNERIE